MKDWLLHLLRLSLKAFFVTLSIFVSLYLVSFYLGPLRLSVSNKNVDQRNLFSVSGEGSVSVKPDMATISLGIVVQSPSVTEGQKKANEKIDQTVIALKRLGLEEKDLKTTAYNIYPNYSYVGGKQSLSGYNVSIDMSVKVRNFDLLNQVIDAATRSGVNQLGAIVFELEKKDEALNQARAEAVKAAKEKAQKLAALAGLRLGKLINVSEGQDFERPPIYALDGAKGVGGAGGETRVQPGQTEIKVTVTLEYEIL